MTFVVTLLFVLTAGCWSVSVYPLYTEKDLVSEPLLLGTWGPCPAEGSCDADIDGDDTVGFNDLTLLLGNWGPC